AVLAELVLRHAGEEPSPALFAALSGGLDRIAEAAGADVVPALLREAWGVVGAFGYRPALDACLQCGAPPGGELARFDVAAGGVRCARCAGDRSGLRIGPVARAQLAALIDGETPPAL